MNRQSGIPWPRCLSDHYSGACVGQCHLSHVATSDRSGHRQWNHDESQTLETTSFDGEPQGQLTLWDVRRKITKVITPQSAENPLALKEHHPMLCEEVTLCFKAVQTTQCANNARNYHETVDGDHRCIETSHYGTSAYTKGCFLCSLPPIGPFAQAVRQHWGIENALGWVLYVSFDTDTRQIRQNTETETFAV